MVRGRKLASLGLASERVTTGPWRHLNPLSSAPGPGGDLAECSMLSECAGVETGGRGQQPVVGQTQSDPLDDPEGSRCNIGLC